MVLSQTRSIYATDYLAIHFLIYSFHINKPMSTFHIKNNYRVLLGNWKWISDYDKHFKQIRTSFHTRYDR